MAKSKLKVSFVWMMILAVVSVLTLGATGVFSSEPPQRKIVVFKKGVDSGSALKIIEKAGGKFKKYYKIINARSVELPSEAAGIALSQNPEVLRIDDDIQVSINKASSTAVKPTQVLPWGVNRIDADLVWGTTTGQAVKVAIIDTGIDTNHPDLQANIKDGINTISATKGYQDDNGHGTHVAGIIGAVNNTVGVIGVAPKVSLYVIKALDRNGSGYLSDIIEGLQWAVDNHMQVVNMSIGTNSDILSFREAIAAAYNAGLIMVVAAGNDGPTANSVDYPAAYPGTIAVAATDSNGQIASWSSRGPQVDIAAPGVNINSTWNNDNYKTISGTSMATPHVTGTAALILSAKDPMTPPMTLDAMRTQLMMTAENLGFAAELQGAGLVDAQKGIQ